MRELFLFVTALLAISSVSAATDLETKDYSREILAKRLLEDISNSDEGELWGIKLDGPLLIVDPETRDVWSSQADGAGLFKKLTNHEGWVGVLPDEVLVANTTVSWEGIGWVMLQGPLPENNTDLSVLVAHEAWHRIENQLSLPITTPFCAHLDKYKPRILMRLEMRALSSALSSKGSDRLLAVNDALSFRKKRLDLTPEERLNERLFDRCEGLANYTGVKLGNKENPIGYTISLLKRFEYLKSFTRTYAYATGPAYGLLLDDYMPNWRSVIQHCDDAPADILAKSVGEALDFDYDVRAEVYNVTEILKEENQRVDDNKETLAKMVFAYTQGARLELPIDCIKIQFNPQGVHSLDSIGTVYDTIVIKDTWGELKASKGALIDLDFKHVYVIDPSEDCLSGPGWNLSLKPNYKIEKEDGDSVNKVLEKQ